MRKLFKERKLFKGGNYMRKYGKRPKFDKNFKIRLQLEHLKYEMTMPYKIGHFVTGEKKLSKYGHNGRSESPPRILTLIIY